MAYSEEEHECRGQESWLQAARSQFYVAHTNVQFSVIRDHAVMIQYVRQNKQVHIQIRKFAGLERSLLLVFATYCGHRQGGFL